MKSLFQPERMAEIRARVTAFTPDAPRQWGKMNAAQALAHIAIALETSVGDVKLDRMLVGYVLGGIAKRGVFKDDTPITRNAPTHKAFVVTDPGEFAQQKARVLALLDRIAAGGHGAMTSHPHTFFGPLTPDEWAVLQYKHTDHHLRQFGA